MEQTTDSLKLLSTSDLSKIFNISQASVYRLIDSRRIPFYKIGGSLRFSEQDIIKYLEACRVEPIFRRK